MLQEEALKEMEARRRMRATIVPTIVEAVKRVLRTMGEPATLFGERAVSCRTSSFLIQKALLYNYLP